jgi:hypothetical protein
MVLLVGLCLVTDWTIRLIVLNAKLSGRNSYIEVSSPPLHSLSSVLSVGFP